MSKQTNNLATLARVRNYLRQFAGLFPSDCSHFDNKIDEAHVSIAYRHVGICVIAHGHGLMDGITITVHTDIAGLTDTKKIANLPALRIFLSEILYSTPIGVHADDIRDYAIESMEEEAAVKREAA